MIKIEIVSAVAHDRTITPKAPSTKPPFTVREQDGYAYTVDRNGEIERHPQKIVLDLEKGQTAYEPGFYTLAPQSVYVGKFGQLNLGRLHLKKLQAQPAVKAA